MFLTTTGTTCISLVYLVFGDENHITDKVVTELQALHQIKVSRKYRGKEVGGLVLQFSLLIANGENTVIENSDSLKPATY